MKNTIYMAPMEGVTDSIYRKTFAKHYGGVTKYFTPFLSPNSTFKFSTRELKEILPEQNDVDTTVPQLLCCNHEHFVWACEQIAQLGYTEINFNLGCPSGTVVTKKKGSGFLYYPDELDRFFEESFNSLSKLGLSNLSISVKTRLGKLDPEDFYEILDIYNKYPISELTIHPRIQSDFYREPLRPGYFAYANEHARMPLVFNGELNQISDISECFDSYENISAVMLGRGLIRNPQLASDYIAGSSSDFDYGKLKAFHDDLLEQYVDVLSGDTPVLHRMKEFWGYWSVNFADSEKSLKSLRKAKHLSDYRAAVSALL